MAHVAHRSSFPSAFSFSSPRPSFRLGAVAVAAVCAVTGLRAQTVAASATAATPLPRVTVLSPAMPGPEVSGFGSEPLSRTPLQASVVDTEGLRDRGATRLSDMLRLDAALGDAYNAPGYWDNFTIRGFVLDNRSNFRRDGLPINAETVLPLENKSQVEVLKGLTGWQSGSASPGGLVNLVVKRPTKAPVGEVLLQWEGASTLLGALDWSTRSADGIHALRVNAVAAHLEPEVRSAKGSRHLLALAGETRLGGWLIEAELETSASSQPSLPGFSLLGNRVPDPVDPRINLNNQPWSQPVEFAANTGSLRASLPLAGGWVGRVQAMAQRLTTQDRLAFPFGCSAVDQYDRYCADGSFDLYDFRSENERRNTAVADASASGTYQLAGWTAEATLGLQRQHFRYRPQVGAYNFAGTGNVEGTAVTTPDASLTDTNTQRDERSTELYARQVLSFGQGTRLWLGLRQVQLARESMRVDGSRPTGYRQSYTLPWLSLSHAVNGVMVYASAGEGVESGGVPGRRRYANAGQALPAEASRQIEAGFKATIGEWRFGAAAFDIQRPVFADFGLCVDATPGSCERRVDGEARHRGLEAHAGVSFGRTAIAGSAVRLSAKRAGSATAAINGLRPTNVPEYALRGEWRQGLAVLPGLETWLAVQAEGNRLALPDDTARIGAWQRWDAGARYQAPSSPVTWRASIDNLLDTRAWKESPFQFGHSYLYPLPPRTLRVSAQLAWR